MAAVFGNIEEEIHGLRNLHGAARVPIGLIGIGHLGERAAIAIAEGALRRHDHAHVLALVHGDVAPPVDRRVLLAGVVDLDAHIQPVARKRSFHAIHQMAHALVLIHAQNGFAVRFHGFRIEGRNCKRRMTDDAQVPFYAARNPGVAQAEVAGLEHRVAAQKLAPGLFIHQRPQTPAQLRQKRGAQAIIFQHGGLPGARLLFAVVIVQDRIGQDAVYAAPAHVLGFFRRDGLRVHIDVGVRILIGFQIRQGIFPPQGRAGYYQPFHRKRAHVAYNPSFSYLGSIYDLL